MDLQFCALLICNLIATKSGFQLEYVSWLGINHAEIRQSDMKNFFLVTDVVIWNQYIYCMGM